MRLGLLAVLPLALVLGACADQTGIMVQISSTDLSVPGDVDGLHIEAFTPDGLMVDQTYPIRSSWPQSLLIRPARGEALGEVRIHVTGTLGGAFLVRRVVMTAFVPGQVRRVDVQLTRDCRFVACTGDSDCVAGVCQGETPDGGVDAGPSDAGTSDVGIDGGTDAGSDVGVDASNDAGSDAASPCAGASCVDHVVISELATAASNEFVELYNRGGTTADVGGCTIEYFQGGSWQARGTLASGTVLPPHGYHLVGNVGYVGPPAADELLWNMGFLDANAAVRLACSGVALDTLGYGTSAPQHEGTPVAAIPTAMVASGSYERRAVADSTATTMAAGGRDATAGNAYDSGDNASDFVIRSTRDPQSSASATEP